MNLVPTTHEEIKKNRLIPKGVWPFTVHKAVDGKSKGKADMITLTLLVYVGNKTLVQTDWLGTWDGGESKLLGFAEATGLTAEYKTGVLTARDCVDAEGYVYITHQKSDEYGDQSQAKSYVMADNVESFREYLMSKGLIEQLSDAIASAPEPVAEPEPVDDDVPF